jgi:hypothetical protein
MKKLVAFTLLFAAGLHADFQVGGNYTYVNLKVEDEPSFHGNLGGAQGSYEYRPADCFYGGVRASWKQGKTESVGADRTLVYVDVHERLGYTFSSGAGDWLCSVFTGFGYRYLGQKFEQSGQPRIKFDYNEFYVPVGFASDYFFSCWFAAGLNFMWMPQVYPAVGIVPLKGALWVLKREIGNVLVEMPFTYYFDSCRQYSVIVKPFYEFWQDGRSTAETALGNELDLPRNTYNFVGVEVNLGFSF